MADAVDPALKPAGELRAAAAKLREMAAATRGGPWSLVKNIQERTGSHMQSTWTRPGLSPQSVKPSQHDDYAWVVLLGPDKAEILAVWLETEAHCLGVSDGVGEKTADLLDAIAGEPLKLSVTVVADTSVPALAFARSILGSSCSQVRPHDDKPVPCTCAPDRCYRLAADRQCQYCARLGPGEECPAVPWDLPTAAERPAERERGGCAAGCDNGPDGSCWHAEEGNNLFNEDPEEALRADRHAEITEAERSEQVHGG